MTVSFSVIMPEPGFFMTDGAWRSLHFNPRSRIWDNGGARWNQINGRAEDTLKTNYRRGNTSTVAAMGNLIVSLSVRMDRRNFIQ